MMVWQLIEQLKKMPQYIDVKIKLGMMLDDVFDVECENPRKCVIIRRK
jgi:hypothetical protein